jgi:hypothetical protein
LISPPIVRQEFEEFEEFEEEFEGGVRGTEEFEGHP